LQLGVGGAAASAETLTTIRSNGDPANRVDIVILGDGYTAAQLTNYAADVETFVQGLFAQDPYKEYQRYFNVHRIDVVSNESGVDHPESVPQIFKDTAFDAAYNCGGVMRTVCVSTTKVNTVLTRSTSAQQRDIVLVIVNDPIYGGSGGAIAVASKHPDAVEIILHELGHSFGLLADEYGGPPPPSCDSTIEPAEVNATKQTVRGLIKWGYWISAATPIPTTTSQAGLPGLYQGAKYCDTNLFRPTFNSKMRSLFQPFDQINSEQLVKRIYNVVSPIDGFAPLGSQVTLSIGRSQTFHVSALQPLSHALTITWKVDGSTVGSGSQLTLSAAQLSAGAHNVTVTVADPTALVMHDSSPPLLQETQSWVLTNVPVVFLKPAADFDGDYKNDIGVYRGGTWAIRQSTDNSIAVISLGGPTWTPVPADYDGDGKTDAAVYLNGTWIILRSSNSQTVVIGAGGPSFVPVPADYDGDGKADVAVYADGVWSIARSSDGVTQVIAHGGPGWTPVPADYDGDGKADVAVYINGAWSIKRSSDNAIVVFGHGGPAWLPVPADYDGDGKADIAVYTNGAWSIKQSSNNAIAVSGHGGPAWLPVPADYDGDGKADIAVYNANGAWSIKQSSNNAINVVGHGGGPTDVPLN